MNEKQKRVAATLRASMDRAGRGPNGQVPEEIRARIIAWVGERVAEGIQQRTLAAALGMHESTISTWIRARRVATTSGDAPSADRAPGLAMVEVKLTRRRPGTRAATRVVDVPRTGRAMARDLVLVDAGGVRVEGLDVASVVAILRGLR